MGKWQYRAIIVAKNVDKGSINSAVSANLDPVGGHSTLTVPLSDDGVNETHYWCSTKLTSNGVDGLKNLAPNFIKATAYVWGYSPAINEKLKTMFSNLSNVKVGEVTLEEVLSDQGLSKLESDGI